MKRWIGFFLAALLLFTSSISFAGTESTNQFTSGRTSLEHTSISSAALQSMNKVYARINRLLADTHFMSQPDDHKLKRINWALRLSAAADQILPDSIEVDEDQQLISFRFAEGILGAVMYGEFHPEMDGSAFKRKEVPGSSVYTEPAAGSSPEQTALPSAEVMKKAVILNSFPASETEPSEIEFRTVFYEQLKTEWDGAGLDTTLIVNPTIEDYQKADQYDVACFSAHGYTYDGMPVICLDELATDSKIQAYYGELVDRQLLLVGTNIGTVFWVLPRFFEQQYDAGDFQNTFVFVQCCQSLGYGKGSNSSKYNYQMANAFINHSAKGYVGYHNSVFSVYGREFMRDYVNQLIKGDTSGAAFKHAAEAIGKNHEVWFEAENSITLKYYMETYEQEKYDPDLHVAYPLLIGDDNALLFDQQ